MTRVFKWYYDLYRVGSESDHGKVAGYLSSIRSHYCRVIRSGVRKVCASTGQPAGMGNIPVPAGYLVAGTLTGMGVNARMQT